MKMKVSASTLLSAVVGIVLLAGCATGERKIENLTVDAAPGANQAQEIAALEANINEGRKNDLEALAPTWFWSAETSLNQAKEAHQDGNNPMRVATEVAEARAQLAKAQEVSQVAKRKLQPVIEARHDALVSRDKARDAGSPKLSELNEELNKREVSFRKLTRAVENENLDGSEKEIQEVRKDYVTIATGYLKREKLDSAKAIVEEAKKADAKRYAPRSLALAEQTIQSTERFIENNPKSTQEVEAKGKEATFLARRALQLTEKSKQLSQDDPEKTVLWVEQSVADVRRQLGTADRRDQRLDEQFKDLASNATLVAGTQRGLTQETERLRSDVSALNTELKSVRPSAELDKKVKELRAKFQKGEADILRNGDGLIIRLKGMRFESGQAEISKENMGVLGRLQDAMAMFPNAAVTVEGHTDSAGSAQINETLSAKRADTIREYLITNNIIDESQIEAVGKGFQQPIAPNSTKAGRAQNRRIDLVLNLNGNTPATKETAAE